jgi:prevent-host-death family protein
MTSPTRYTTLTSREFNQDAGGAKRAAEEGPVYITDRGRPAHVLLSIDEYRRLTGTSSSIVDLIGMSEGADIGFEPAKATIDARPADFG